VHDRRGRRLHPAGRDPESYHAFAFAKDAGVDFRDPDAAKDIEDQGRAITVAEGERRSVVVEVAPQDR